jgi:hypothetical protein
MDESLILKALGESPGVIDRDQSRRMRVEIRHVFIDLWDVKDEPSAQDEYEGDWGGV